MRRHLIHFLLALLLSVASAATVHAQNNVKGQVVDAETSEPLIGAAVTVVGGTSGVVTDIDGNFTISASANATLKISYLGYQEQTLKVPQSRNLGIIKMRADAVLLNDVIITSSVAVSRKTPVAVSTLDPVFIEEKLGTQEFPEILKSTPGVYATKQGGGFGDSKINLRGFKSENIAVMVNGVPMNDMEWGGVYWSNWAGLSDVTRTMQVQRGIGASKVSAPSVGGSINVITNSTDAKKGGTISYALGNDNDNKIMFSVSSGLTKNGWAFSLLGAKRWGDGYVQGTDFESYNYFVNISKRINDNHQLSFTAFGAPQVHNQRSRYDGLTIKGWQEVKKHMNGDSPYKYNATYGFGRNGERKTSARNEYHKPQISLNHLWQIDEKSSLSTSLYTSIGRGNGYSGQYSDSNYSSAWYGSTDGVLNTQFRNTDGTFAYDKIYDLNEASSNGSVLAMSKNKNFHNWYGLLSTYTNKLNDNWEVMGGVDFRYYKGVHTNELIDLYGGEYYIDRYRAQVNSANHPEGGTDAFKYKKLTVGDVVYRDYDGYTVSEGVFGQAEYSLDKLNAFVSGSLSNTTYWRYDRFYYGEGNRKSKTVNFIGWTAKGGANYNLTENHNVFANVGFISRAPFFSGGAFLQATSSNATNPDAVNEKILSFEIGYGYQSRFLSANLNIYHTNWMDKTMTKIVNFQATGDRGSLNMEGVDALHRGIELDFVAKPFQWLDITGMFSIGDWKWNSNTKGYFYTSGGQPVANASGDIASGIQAPDHATMTVNLKDVKVGGSAQTTAALGVNFKIDKNIRLGLDYNFFGRNYADWDFNSNDLIINGEKTYTTPWRIPSAHTFDFNASYSFNLGSTRATLSGNINNLFDQEYIADAYYGGSNNWEDVYRVFYGFGRTYSIRLKVKF